MDDKKKPKKEEKKNDDLKEVEVEGLKAKVAEFEDNWKRAVADYRNLEKRVEEGRRDMILFSNKELLLRLLPSFDMLFMAEKHIEDEGLKITVKGLNDALNEVGVERVETKEKQFDPQTMECVESVNEGDTVIEELRPGFLLNGKLLRPAMVKVGRD